MRFAAPELFALIALAVLLAWLLWRAGRAPRPRFLFPHAPPAAAGGGVRGRAARWLPALRVAAAICAIAAIARPQATTVEALEPAGGIDIVLAIDASSSMTRHALDGGAETRLDAARRVAREFVAERGDDRVGLVMFQRRAVVLSPLTLDLDAVDALIAGSVRSGLIPDGTGVGVALAESVNLLRASDAASRVVVLLTDGENNVPDIAPVQAAAVARALGVRVYTVGLPSLRADETVTLDELALVYIADETGGRYFRAASGEDLAAAYAEVAELERGYVGVEERLSARELAPWLLAAAAALIVLGLAARAGPLRTVP